MLIRHSQLLGWDRIVDGLLFGEISGATTYLLPAHQYVRHPCLNSGHLLTGPLGRYMVIWSAGGQRNALVGEAADGPYQELYLRKPKQRCCSGPERRSPRLVEAELIAFDVLHHEACFVFLIGE